MSRDPVERLIEKYPRTFFQNQADRRPLKIGLHRDLVADTARHGLSRDELRKALARYCSSPGYAAATVLNAPRIDLAGEPAGLVTADAVSAAIRAARLSRKSGRERREIRVEGKAVVAAAAPEPSTNQNNQNGTRLSLTDLRNAAQQRRAARHSLRICGV
jgi:ProP effector